MGIKVFAEGSLGAHTAWLFEPYQDLPESEGMPMIEKDELTKIVEEVHNAGLQLAIHAIGDRAIDMVLEAYGRLKDPSLQQFQIQPPYSLNLTINSQTPLRRYLM